MFSPRVDPQKAILEPTMTEMATYLPFPPLERVKESEMGWSRWSSTEVCGGASYQTKQPGNPEVRLG